MDGWNNYCKEPPYQIEQSFPLLSSRAITLELSPMHVMQHCTRHPHCYKERNMLFTETWKMHTTSGLLNFTESAFRSSFRKLPIQCTKDTKLFTSKAITSSNQCCGVGQVALNVETGNIRIKSKHFEALACALTQGGYTEFTQEFSKDSIKQHNTQMPALILMMEES